MGIHPVMHSERHPGGYFSCFMPERCPQGGIPRVGYPSLHASSHTPGGIYASLPASLCTGSWCTLPTPSCSSGVMTLLAGTSTRLGFLLRKEAFLTLIINHYPAGNRRIMTKKPATESACAQGQTESPNPSSGDLKPPSRLEQADNGGSGGRSYPLYSLGVGIKPD